MKAAGLRLVEAPVGVRDDAPLASAEAYVTAHPRGASYQRPIWLDVIRAAFGHETKYLVAEAAGQLVGVLPLVFFRSRIFGPMATAGMPHSAKVMASAWPSTMTTCSACGL
jgi:hypothetical protein